MSITPDTSVGLLLKKMPKLHGNWIIVADENWYGVNWSTFSGSDGKTPLIFSNRIDIAEAVQTAGLACTFNDFDFSSLPQQSLDGILYRVSKERATSHHVINCARTLLKPSATLLLSGQKNDGIKTYVKQAGQLFDDSVSTEKNGNAYTATIQLNQLDGGALDDKDYPQLRPVQTKVNLTFQSKPGIFGWNKIDLGSQFLVDYLAEFLAGFKKPPRSVLDLGCGYGYLSLQAMEQGFERLVATDNNAAALLATRENLGVIDKASWDVIGADAGNQISETFDTILCNPPFHSGFAIDGALSIKFLSNTKRLLKKSGKALFVVNSFIPLEHKATNYFDHINLLTSNGSFKLIMLS